MSLQNASMWTAHFVVQNQSTPDTVPGSPTMIYIGHVTAGQINPAPNYKKVKRAGSLDYAAIHKLSEKPETTIKIEMSRIAYVRACINDIYHVLAFRNTTDNQTIRYIGAKIDSLDLSCDVDDTLMADVTVQARSVDSSAVSGANYQAAVEEVIDYTDIEISKGGTPVNSWLKTGLKIDNRIKRRINNTNGATRALERTERDHEWTYALDVASASALDEFNSIKNDTAFAFKFAVTDSQETWSATMAGSKYTDLGFDPFDSSDILGKDLTGSGTTLTYGT
jgi:hypothetical protein